MTYTRCKRVRGVSPRLVVHVYYRYTVVVVGSKTNVLYVSVPPRRRRLRIGADLYPKTS